MVSVKLIISRIKIASKLSRLACLFNSVLLGPTLTGKYIVIHRRYNKRVLARKIALLKTLTEIYDTHSTIHKIGYVRVHKSSTQKKWAKYGPLAGILLTSGLFTTQTSLMTLTVLTTMPTFPTYTPAKSAPITISPII